MAKSRAPVGDHAKIKNLADGARDYPLNSGGSVFLPPKGRGICWPVIPVTEIGEALRNAESKGLITIKIQEGGAQSGAGTTQGNMD